jgi:hypothetical protein
LFSSVLNKDHSIKFTEKHRQLAFLNQMELFQLPRNESNAYHPNVPITKT